MFLLSFPAKSAVPFPSINLSTKLFLLLQAHTTLLITTNFLSLLPEFNRSGIPGTHQVTVHTTTSRTSKSTKPTRWHPEVVRPELEERAQEEEEVAEVEEEMQQLLQQSTLHQRNNRQPAHQQFPNHQHQHQSLK